MPSEHRVKRPYAGSSSQSSITSFFHPTSSGSESSTHDASHSPSLSPALPSTVQSSLLNVGMRVRKSVPEGYKTGSYSAFALSGDAPAQSTTTVQRASPHEVNERGSVSRGAYYQRHELTPFCGINKVGGLAVQEVPDEDDVPWLSSQASTASDLSVDWEGRTKRRLDDDEVDDELQIVGSEEEEDFIRVYGKVKGSSRTEGRVMAKMRKRKGNANEVGKTGDGAAEAMDFGEAEFLRPLGEEVEMNDV
jgi:hypothetical protein